jgi:anti-anti-sigma factor
MHIEVPSVYERTGYSDERGCELNFGHRGGYVVFDLDGPLVMRWVADELCQEVRAMLEGGRKDLIIDLTDVPYTDSAGIGALVAANSLIQRAGGKLVLLSAQRRVLEMLKRMRLEPYFTFSDDPEFGFRKS